MQISRAESGVNLPPPELIVALIQKADVNPAWLLTGLGPMSFREALSHYGPDYDAAVVQTARNIADEQKSLAIMAATAPAEYEEGFRLVGPESLTPADAPRAVTVVGKVAAGQSVGTGEADQFPPGCADSYIIYAKGTSPPPKAIAVKVTGDSMVPDYRPGNIVIADPSSPPVTSGVAVVRWYNEAGEIEAALKVIRRRGGRVILESLNPKGPRIDLPQEAILSAYKVVRKVRLKKGD
jgi:phage repressor protein C with HTH and peptisase S24 domain